MIARTRFGPNNYQRTFQHLLRKVCRSSSTSASTISFSATAPFVETNETMSNTDQQNTQNRNHDYIHDKLRNDLTYATATLPIGTIKTSISSDSKIFGVEVHPIEAASIAKTESAVMDKILLFISHGETKTRSETEESDMNLSLSGKGVGHALNISKEINAFCNQSTGLMPQLYVVSPLRCTTESALLAFPYDAPGNIHSMSWICHNKCVDDNFDDEISVNSVLNDFERSFPGVDYNLMREATDTSSDSFLSWVAQRDERVIVVSSTKSWIDEFINTFAPTKTRDNKTEDNSYLHNRYLRTVCMKFH